MATKINHTLTNTFYFVTITCFKWLPLFEASNVYDYFSEWTNHLKKGGITISGYVFMPNHLHLLVFVHPKCLDFNKLIGNAKRFLAYEIVKRLKWNMQTNLLEQLVNGVRKEELAKGKRHQIFQPSFDAKEIYGVDKILSILDYIHHNPVSKRWMLVIDYTDYQYSSAQFYFSGKQKGVEVVDFRDVWKVNIKSHSSESSASDSEG